MPRGRPRRRSPEHGPHPRTGRRSAALSPGTGIGPTARAVCAGSAHLLFGAIYGQLLVHSDSLTGVVSVEPPANNPQNRVCLSISSIRSRQSHDCAGAPLTPTGSGKQRSFCITSGSVTGHRSSTATASWRYLRVMKSPEVDLPKDIGAPATRALVAVGYTRLAQLANVPLAELKQLHGVGPRALTRLQEALEQQDMSLR